MGRRKKVATGVDLSVPDCLKPLVDNKKIMTYIITHCTEGTSDKIYIFIVVATAKSQPKFLARFWGAFGGELSGIHELYNKDEFQKLINEKAAKGYRIVNNTEITECEDVYGAAAEAISNYVDSIAKLAIGAKTQLEMI